MERNNFLQNLSASHGTVNAMVRAARLDRIPRAIWRGSYLVLLVFIPAVRAPMNRPRYQTRP